MTSQPTMISMHRPAEEISEYALNFTGHRHDQGFVPVIEVRGRDRSGQLHEGYTLFPESGYHSRKEDAAAVARSIKVKSVVLDGGTLRVRGQ